MIKKTKNSDSHFTFNNTKYPMPKYEKRKKY